MGFDAADSKLFEKLTNYPIESALKGIDILIKNQIKVKLCVVVTKYNIGLSKIVNFCEEKDIKNLRFYWFIPRETNDHSLISTEKDYEEKRIKKLQRKY